MKSVMSFKPKNYQLPEKCLMAHKDGYLVVIKTGPIDDTRGIFPGVVVVSGSEDCAELGFYSERWVESEFSAFAGTVTLEN